MSFSRDDYIELGCQVGAPSLIDGGSRVLGVWREDVALLTPRGFGNERVDELALMLTDIETRYRAFGGSEGGRGWRSANS